MKYDQCFSAEIAPFYEIPVIGYIESLHFDSFTGLNVVFRIGFLFQLVQQFLCLFWDVDFSDNASLLEFVCHHYIWPVDVVSDDFCTHYSSNYRACVGSDTHVQAR